MDPAQHRYLEEAGSANIVVLMKDGTVVTPKSESILPSVTRRSVMTIAGDELGHATEERPIDFLAEVDQIEEFAACGTAAVISPVGKIRWTIPGTPFMAMARPLGQSRRRSMIDSRPSKKVRRMILRVDSARWDLGTGLAAITLALTGRSQPMP